MRRSLWLVVVVGLLGFSTAGWADPIGPGCSTCFGSIITLTYDPNSGPDPGPTDTWRITLKINTSGYVPNDTITPHSLSQISLKVTSGGMNSVISAMPVSAPATWGMSNIFIGDLGGMGCTPGMQIAFFCDDGSSNPTVPNGTLVWSYDVEINDGALLTGANQAVVKARYINSMGNSAQSTNEFITLQQVPAAFTTQQVPEASTTALLGLGLLSLGLLGRKRLKARR